MTCDSASTRQCGLHRRRTERRLMRDYIPTINAIAVGFGLIGLAQGLRLLLVIFGSTDASLRALTSG